MQGKWLNKALQNLNDEAQYVAQDDPIAARLVVVRINDAVNRLADSPAMGHPGRLHATRELVVPGTRCIIPYRVRPRLNYIEILRVFHTSRRSSKHW